MDIDFENLSKGILAFRAALSTLKQAKDLMPNSAKKSEANKALERAEQEFKLAEASMAQKLGYEICLAHFPPVIMLEQEQGNWICPECQKQKHTGPVYFA